MVNPNPAAWYLISERLEPPLLHVSPPGSSCKHPIIPVCRGGSVPLHVADWTVLVTSPGPGRRVHFQSQLIPTSHYHLRPHFIPFSIPVSHVSGFSSLSHSTHATPMRSTRLDPVELICSATRRNSPVPLVHQSTTDRSYQSSLALAHSNPTRCYGVGNPNPFPVSLHQLRFYLRTRPHFVAPTPSLPGPIPPSFVCSYRC